MIQNYCSDLSLKALVLVLAFLLACLNIGSLSVLQNFQSRPLLTSLFGTVWSWTSILFSIYFWG